MKKVGFVFLAILMLLLGVAAGGVSGYYVAQNYAAPPADATEPWEEKQPERVLQTAGTVTEIAELCTESVVNITVEREVKSYTGGSSVKQTTTGHGTGVIIRADGYIVTCHHVIEDAKTIKVTFDDNTEMDGSLVGQDERFDLAVIKVDGQDLQAAALGDSNAIRAGDGVVVIGNPLGEFGSSVSAGVLSAPTREITIEGVPLRLMQTDAAVNPGNSGGGLFDMRGELVGIVNAKISASGIEGIGFAIPWATIQGKVDSIIENGNTGKKAVLGVSTKPSSCYVDQKKVSCLEVVSVKSEGPAEKAGLEVGDMLISANGKNLEENNDLTLLVKYLSPGESLEFEVYRNEKTVTVTVVLGEE